MIKTADAGLEPSSMTDPRTGRRIRISISVRKKYRQYFQGQQDREMLHILRNIELNDEIAKDFAAASGNVVHMFFSKDSDLNSRPPRIVWMEIRKQTRGPRSVFNFFISKIGPEFIDILRVTQGYIKPIKPRIVKAKVENVMINKILDIIRADTLEKMAAKGDGKQGQNTEELIASVRAAGKRLKKSKKTINDVISMIKGIEESGIKAKKSKEYIRRTINDKLPTWCIKEKTPMHGPGKSGKKAE